MSLPHEGSFACARRQVPRLVALESFVGAALVAHSKNGVAGCFAFLFFFARVLFSWPINTSLLLKSRVSDSTPYASIKTSRRESRPSISPGACARLPSATSSLIVCGCSILCSPSRGVAACKAARYAGTAHVCTGKGGGPGRRRSAPRGLRPSWLRPPTWSSPWSATPTSSAALWRLTAQVRPQEDALREVYADHDGSHERGDGGRAREMRPTSAGGHHWRQRSKEACNP